MRISAKPYLCFPALAAIATTGLTSHAVAADFIKANNITNLNLAGSYTANSGVPGASDTIVIDSTLTATQSTALGANMGILGIRYASNAQTGDRMRINATGNHTLSVGSGGIDMSSTTGDVRLRIDSKIDFTANQSWSIASGARVNMNPTNVTGSGGSATVSGLGTVSFDVGGTGTLGSVITLNNSVVQINLSSTTATFNNANNSYGRLNLYNGRGIFADISNKNANSSAGTGSTDAILGGSGTNGIFEFSGSNTTTNRGFQVDNRSTASGIDVTTSGVTLTINGNISSVFGTSTSSDSGLVFGGAGNLTIGGVINDKADATGKTSVTKNGGGALTVSNANTYEGGTTVSAGTLLVNNTTGSGTGAGAVTVNGGTVGGNGSIAGGLTVNATGVLAPGNSTGLLTVGSLDLNANSSTNLEIDGVNRGQVSNGYDALNISTGGSIDLAGALSFAFGNLSAFAANTEFDLFSFDTTSTGDFTGVTSTGFYTGTWSKSGDIWSLTDAGQTLNFSEVTGNLTVVPEPTAALLGSVGAILLLRRRRN